MLEIYGKSSFFGIVKSSSKDLAFLLKRPPKKVDGKGGGVFGRAASKKSTISSGLMPDSANEVNGGLVLKLFEVRNGLVAESGGNSVNLLKKIRYLNSTSQKCTG